MAAVAFELDGREVARLAKSPWAGSVDFGTEYAPHELVARAFDAKGRELTLARQWINLPRAAAEIEILLERDKRGRATAARLTWASRAGSVPTGTTLTFDGRELVLDGDHRATLPAYDPSLAHVLTAQADFPRGLHGRADRVIGGGRTEEAGSELTAIPIRVESGKPPSVESLQGRFRKNGEVLQVVAVERAPALVLVVRNLDEHSEALRHFPGAYHSGWERTTDLERGDRLRVVWPVASETADGDAVNVVFDASRDFTGMQANFGFALVRVEYVGPSPAPRRFADAVAVAGVSAAANGSRRAVVLALGELDRDQSVRDAGSVRRYLERIHVPLYVWSLAGQTTEAPAAAWGQYEDVSTAKGFRRAAGRVLDDLKKQSVVWLEGRHLPQDIVLTESGDGISIAR